MIGPINKKSYYLDPTQDRIYRMKENDAVLYDEEFPKVSIKLFFSRFLNNAPDYERLRHSFSEQYPSITKEEEKHLIEQTMIKCKDNKDIFEKFYAVNSELYKDITQRVYV